MLFRSEGIIQLAQQEHSDVILLGTSRENLLSQVIKGSVPMEVARQTDMTVILLRQMEESPSRSD